ncbi:MAG: CoB--CoM heterodisulfide reductase iron-sulfur subunit A family protein [Bacteroidales bacterium]|nr:CoB--CoM heterodisulfide reductase iron-sulfur subunit A family protein [Bacteroidales bacterium]
MKRTPSKTVLVIGGGIAGMEAAARLRQLGLQPILVEKSDHLGGHVADWHKLFPDMSEAAALVEKGASALDGVDVRLSTEILFVNRLRSLYNVMLSSGSNVQCGAIVVATGFSLFPAEKKEEYGYGIYDHVITNADLEKWFNTGEDPRVTDDVRKVGFVHCVGSRDLKAGNTECSKVCCITAIKQAIEMKEHFPEAEIYCFYMDLRLFGKRYEDYYIKAQRDYGIHFIRGRVSEVGENIEGKVVVKAEDTLSGRPVKVTLDLLVLMAGIIRNPDAAGIARSLSLMTGEEGFLRSRDNLGGITASDRKGIFFAGTCTGPKTIPETLAEADRAALSVHEYLKG